MKKIYELDQAEIMAAIGYWIASGAPDPKFNGNVTLTIKPPETGDRGELVPASISARVCET